MTPDSQDYFDRACTALNQEQWDKATAYATTGLLGFAIGAAKAMLGWAPTDD